MKKSIKIALKVYHVQVCGWGEGGDSHFTRVLVIITQDTLLFSVEIKENQY